MLNLFRFNFSSIGVMIPVKFWRHIKLRHSNIIFLRGKNFSFTRCEIQPKATPIERNKFQMFIRKHHDAPKLLLPKINIFFFFTRVCRFQSRSICSITSTMKNIVVFYGFFFGFALFLKSFFDVRYFSLWRPRFVSYRQI